MTQDNKSWEENWSEEFDEKFVDKPESYTTHEEPYKIGERNYTGEHYIMPAYTLKLNIGQAEIKRFIHSTLNKEREEERNRLIEKVEFISTDIRNGAGDEYIKRADILTILKKK